ncbi:MAG: hypothetical protein ACYS0K_02570 [Planctomycetota bacterium]
MVEFKRGIVLLGLLGLVSCGDPGLRDRSLMSLDEAYGNRLSALRHRKKHAGRTSVIGLATDPLAQYYPEGAALVVRFSDPGTLAREVAPQLRDLQRFLPRLKLPAGKPTDMIRQVAGLPRVVSIDPVRPFAFVKVENGWAAIIPTRNRDKGSVRLRQLDAVYCVAGDPGVVAAYRPGFRKGFYLPGDVSLIAKRTALPKLGACLTEVAAPLDLDLTLLDRWMPPVPTDIQRVDIGLRLRQGGLRVDIRAAPDPDSQTAVFLERLKPSTSAAARWLPSQGTFYVELLCPPADWDRFLLVFLRDLLPPLEGARAQLHFSLGRFLTALGRDASALVTLDDKGKGTLLLVANLDDAQTTQSFFGSYDFTHLLEAIAGPGGNLEWTAASFQRSGVRVGAIRGRLSRDRLLEWRRGGSVFFATLGVLLRAPATCYVAVVGDKLCIVTGHGARDEMERAIDHLQKGAPVDNDHNLEVVSLFPQRLAAASVDLAALFDGTREAATYWHPQGRNLRDLSLRWRLPASVAVTAEGGALRAAIRVRPTMLAEAAAAIEAQLAKK